MRYFYFVITILILIAALSNAQAQRRSAHAVVFEDALVVEIPEGFTKTKKKLLRQYQPSCKIKSGVAYRDDDGSKLLLYQTDIPWNFTPVSIWDMALAAMENYPGHKFLESGYYIDQRNAKNPIYFVKIQARMDHREECLLLTFTPFKGKVFQGIYVTHGNNYDVWKATSAQLLTNHYIRATNSTY